MPSSKSSSSTPNNGSAFTGNPERPRSASDVMSFRKVFGDRYSHSMVPGGLLVMSNTTRLTSATSLVIRVEMHSNTS